MTSSAAERRSERSDAAVGPHLEVAGWIRHGIWRPTVAGAVIGAVLVLISPLVAAIAALTVAVVGIGLSQARRREYAHRVLYGSVGLMAPALADLIAQLVRLL